MKDQYGFLLHRGQLSLPLFRVRCDFDQVAVRVAAVDGGDRTERTRSGDRSRYAGNVAAAEMVEHLLGRRFRDEAEIKRAGRIYVAGLPVRGPCPPHIELLLAKHERGAVIVIVLRLHTEN